MCGCSWNNSRRAVYIKSLASNDDGRVHMARWWNLSLTARAPTSKRSIFGSLCSDSSQTVSDTEPWSIVLNQLLLLTTHLKLPVPTNQEPLISVTLVSFPFLVSPIKHLNSLGVFILLPVGYRLLSSSATSDCKSAFRNYARSSET